MANITWNGDPLTWNGEILTWGGASAPALSVTVSAAVLALSGRNATFLLNGIPVSEAQDWVPGGRRRGGRSLYVGSSPVPPWDGYDDDPKFWNAVRDRRQAAEARRVADEAQRADDERRARAARAVSRPKATPKPKPDPWREEKQAVRKLMKIAEVQDRQMILDTLWGLIDSGALSEDMRALLEQAIEAV
jgi:hypothetical protein